MAFHWNSPRYIVLSIAAHAIGTTIDYARQATTHDDARYNGIFWLFAAVDCREIIISMQTAFQQENKNKKYDCHRLYRTASSRILNRRQTVYFSIY